MARMQVQISRNHSTLFKKVAVILIIKITLNSFAKVYLKIPCTSPLDRYFAVSKTKET